MSGGEWRDESRYIRTGSGSDRSRHSTLDEGFSTREIFDCKLNVGPVATARGSDVTSGPPDVRFFYSRNRRLRLSVGPGRYRSRFCNDAPTLRNGINSMKLHHYLSDQSLFIVRLFCYS